MSWCVCLCDVSSKLVPPPPPPVYPLELLSPFIQQEAEGIAPFLHLQSRTIVYLVKGQWPNDRICGRKVPWQLCRRLLTPFMLV